MIALVPFGLLLAFSAMAADNPDALDLIKNMQASARNLNYQGTFVYLHSGKMESMRVYHRVEGQLEQERVVHLNGPPREVIRKNNVVTCILSDHKSVMVSKLESGRHILSALPDNFGDFKQNYRVSIAGRGRVAGRDTNIVVVAPGDHFRYGYKFWLDAKNSLLLKSQMLGEDGEPIEQIMFTSLDDSAVLPAALLEPSVKRDDFVMQEEPHTDAAQSTAQDHWKIEGLPEGFKAMEQSFRQFTVGAPIVQQIILSDGLASVSVYIEKIDPHKKRLVGHTFMGAVNAYGRVIDDHQVMVVGEVPRATVQKVADSIHYSKP